MVDVYGIGFHTLFQLSILHLLLLVYLPIVSHHYITIINHHKPSSTIIIHWVSHIIKRRVPFLERPRLLQGLPGARPAELRQCDGGEGALCGG